MTATHYDRVCPGGVEFRTRPGGQKYPICPSGWESTGRRGWRASSGGRRSRPKTKMSAPVEDADTVKIESESTESNEE